MRRDGEDQQVLCRRYLEALAAGLSVQEAEIFAVNGEDIGLLRKLVAAKCAPELIAGIVV